MHRERISLHRSKNPCIQHHNEPIKCFNVSRDSKPCLETSPATLVLPGPGRKTSLEPQKHVARRRRRLSGPPGQGRDFARDVAECRQSPKSMSRNVARDVARAPWRCRHRPTPMSRDVARDIRATPPVILGLFVKSVKEFVLGELFPISI